MRRKGKKGKERERKWHKDWTRHKLSVMNSVSCIMRLIFQSFFQPGGARLLHSNCSLSLVSTLSCPAFAINAPPSLPSTILISLFLLSSVSFTLIPKLKPCHRKLQKKVMDPMYSMNTSYPFLKVSTFAPIFSALFVTVLSSLINDALLCLCFLSFSLSIELLDCCTLDLSWTY